MSEQYRQPLGLVLLGAVLWLLGLIGEKNDARSTGGVILDVAGIGGVLFFLFGAIWLVVLLLRPKRD